MALLGTTGLYIYGVLLPITVLMTVSWAQAPPQCPTEECNIQYRAKLEEVNQALKNAVEQVNRTLAEQKSLINKWKSCSGNNDTQPQASAYVAEKLATMEPCNAVVGTASNILGVTQLQGVIFVLCRNSADLRAYDARTLQALPNLTLPSGATGRGKSPSYIVANNFEKSLYVGVSSQDAASLSYYPGYDIWRTDLSFNWVQLSTAQKDPTFNIFRLRVSRNGQMMYANKSHILFPQTATTYSRAILFGKPPLGEVDNIRGLVERKDGSFVGWQTFLIRVNANGDFIGRLADGPVIPTNDNVTSINDLDQGPDEMLLISDVMNDRVLIVNADTNQVFELIRQEVNGTRTTKLWRPCYLSYDAQSQLLVVGEYQDRSIWSVENGVGSLKVFRIKPKA